MNALHENPRFLAVAGLLALTVAMGIGRFVYTPILPFMVTELGLSKAEAGLIASANFLGYLLGALTAAWRGLPGSGRAWFLGALVVSVTTTGAMAGGDSISTFLTIRFIGGWASAFVMVFAAALVLDRLAAAGQTGLAAVHFAGVGIGIVVSSGFVASLASAGADWRGLWLGSGALCLFGLMAVYPLVPPDKATNKQDKTAPIGLNRSLWFFIVSYGLFGFGYVITGTFINDLVRSHDDLRLLEPVIWLIVGVGAVPSVALWTWVALRWSDRVAYGVACVIEAVGVALSVLSDKPAMLMLAALLLGATFMGITAVGLVSARARVTGDPRPILALMTAAFGLGQMIGPTFAGYLFDQTGSYFWPSLTAAAALLLAAVLVIPMRPTASNR